MKAYALLLTCPRCGGALEHVNDIVQETYAVGVCACPACRQEFVVSIAIRSRHHDVRAQRATTTRRREVYA